MRRLLVTVVLALALAAPAGAEEFKVIVHASNSVASLTREQLSRLFLKKATSWEGGGTVAPVDQTESSPVRVAFSKVVHKKTVGEVKSYWQQQIFSGRAVPPLVKASDAQVVAFVEGNAQAVGYVTADAPTGSAKVVRVE